ncbi:MAG TPA: hypothetical protein VGP47_07350 [Parachlamydiaceae bacterium]|nr:hypothetical protein [Parachlamydiaceae bacterium]
MKKLLSLALACLSISVQSLAADCCPRDCYSDCFGFDSVLTFDVGGGYRMDSLKWKIFPAYDPGRQVEEQWKNIGSGVVETNAQFLACEHYLLMADFDFGWFTNKGSQRYTGIGGTINPINLKSNPRGNVYNLSGGLGYQFNFDCYRVSFAPLAGYSYHQQRFKSRTYKNQIISDVLAPSLVLAHNNYKFRWSGPWVGFALAYQATCELQVYVDYYYHWARFHGTVKERFAFFPGQFPTHLKSNRVYGNEFTVGTTYTFCDYWYVGVKYDYKQFCGNKGKANEETSDFDSALRSLEWRSSTITLDIGYTF